MKTKIIPLMILAGAIGLSSCGMYDPSGYTSYQSYNYEDLVPYAEGTSGPEVYQDAVENPKQVFIPSTYHVGAYHSPTSFKDRDRGWVNGQSAQNYTIEIADAPKASFVAGKLFKAPKSERAAQVQYHKGSQSYYKGLYGSFTSYEAAEKALQSLPPDVQQGAQIKSFGSVQNSVGN